MAAVVADIFDDITQHATADPRREGNLLRIGDRLDVLVAGDLHGNRRHLDRIIRYADLAANPRRILVLQEIIHGPPDPTTGHDRSVELLLRAVRLKQRFAGRVVFLLGNHDLSQATGHEILKSGHSVCQAFDDGVRAAFGADGDEVLAAVRRFLLSAPLALQCPGGVLVSHSVPSPADTDDACIAALTRPLQDDDVLRGGPAYKWVWGRGQTAGQLQALAERLGVSFFVLGHARLDAGFEPLGDRAVAITSEDQHGCVFQFPSDTSLTPETAGQCVKPLATLGD